MKARGKSFRVKYLQLLLFHIVMALVIYQFNPAGKIFLFAIIGYFLIKIFSSGNRNDEILIAAAYITGFEVFSRMLGGVGFSYEFAKYVVIGFMLLGMFFKGFNRKSWPYVIFLLLLIPGVLFSAINLDYDSSVGNAIGFNLSGPVCLAITALYCYNRKMVKERFQEVLLALLLPIIATTTYLYVYTPNVRDVLTGTQSNFEASGGFGPNQVATILGLGVFILFSRLLIIKDRLVNIIDVVLLALICYRGIVTFSRGGMITAAVCAVLFVFFYYFRISSKEKGSLIPKIVFIVIVIGVTWLRSSFVTEGLIDKRYANQDAAGRVKEDITTGRKDLINEELQAFYDYPITGVGVGKTKEFREQITGYATATHNEVSRMLSEHGIFGLTALAILLFTPLIFRLSNKSNPYLISFLLFWLLTINHSSMRISAPAFVYGLTLISIVSFEKKDRIYRKSVITE
ncbi:O-antigen ligase family protein [Aureisphaera sp. CAU 1614]|uniref:O-antigen ligase family protein n=1 Tax=Halomarinibacterium sedimenti TaxID=2857106 RepID=A0A9X1JVG2_9FLAO|nr:O-antigen ligase family protein [Halomarinibacterium sedimenti]MBW2937700.1 O-antigen ligase family protein [Halomarinibacterium sedimenti]